MRALSSVVRRALVVTLLIACLGTTGLAQDAASGSPPAAPAAEPAQPPPPYAATEIPRAAERALSRLRRIRAGLADGTALASRSLELDALSAAMSRLSEFTFSHELPSLSDRSLGALQQRWSVAQRDLADIVEPLEREARAVEAEAAEARGLRDRWERTRTLALAEEYPPAILERVVQTLAAIEELESDLRTPRDALGAQLALAYDRQATIEEALESIEEARRAVAKKLFSADDVPLWKVSMDGEERTLGAQAARSLRQLERGLADLRASYGSRLLLHLALLTALIVTTITVARRTPVAELAAGDDAMQAAARILRRPFASSLVITLVLTPWFYPRAALVVFDLNYLLVFLPAIRILPRAVVGAARGPFYGLVALFVLDQARKLTSDGSPLQRLLLALVTLAGIAVFLWLRRAAPRRIVTRFASVAAAVLAFSFVGNVLGFARLSTTMTSTTLGSAFVAVILYAGTLALGGLFALALRTPALRALAVVANHAAAISRGFTTLLRAFALFLWAVVTLAVAGVWKGVSDTLAAALSYDVSVGSLTISAGDIVAFFVALVVAVYFSRALRFVLKEDVFPRMNLERGVPEMVSMLVNYGVIAVGVLLAAAAAGIELDRIALVASALGVGIGFGLQTIVNNFVSGLILTFERPVQIGDEVEVGSLRGIVKRIGIRASTVRTFSGAEVIIPNGNLVANEVINWTFSDALRRIDIPVGVAYGTDPRRVVGVLQKAILGIPEILTEPKPMALFRAFGESSLDFELRIWIGKTEGWPQIISDATIAVHDALAAEGIEIPFPQRDVHIRPEP